MIGVFDSGYGGLSVLKYFLEYAGEYDYIYLGDNARVPYGNKSHEVIYEYTRQGVDFLFQNGCQLVILACNTASAIALRKLQQVYLPAHYPDCRILGVIRPIVEDIVKDGKPSRIGVIATKATIDSDVYAKEIVKFDKDRVVIGQAAPLLAPLIEEEFVNEKLIDIALDDYLDFVFKKDIDELVLACTHYPLVIEKIRSKLPALCTLKHPGEAIAKSLSDYLKRHPELETKRLNEMDKRLAFFTTDSVKIFKEKGEKFLGQKITNVLKINL